MTTVWYVCPYEVSVGKIGLLRRPAIARHIPTFPDPLGSVWDEAEILGNHVVVKVIAPDAVHLIIQADADFDVIPHIVATIPAPVRNRLRTRLEALGYTSQEITDTNWTVTGVLALLTTAASMLQRNAAGTGIDLLPGRRPAPKTVAQIEARLPG